jgi:23S rRNA (guanosine2251-2'-O)-methyltransferase
MSDFRPSRRDRTTSRQRSPDRQASRPLARAHEPFDTRRWLYGTHAVVAALANPERRWRRLVVLVGRQSEATALVAGARASRCGKDEAVRVLDHDGFAAILPVGAVHQGLALEVEPLAERDLDDALSAAGEMAGRSIIVVLDQISDPQNVGAILRSAAAFGALAVVVSAHGAPPATGALAKAASGAVEIVPLVRVVNLARALDRLKEAAFWICGLDETAPLPLARLELGERIALVLGAEGSGMRRLVRQRCDLLARLPTGPAQRTLNVSNAAAVALYELVRSRVT